MKWVNYMDVYENETREVIERFLGRRISFPGCITALDAALDGLILPLTGEQIVPLRRVMLANNTVVMKEMERRGLLAALKTSPRRRPSAAVLV